MKKDALMERAERVNPFGHTAFDDWSRSPQGNQLVVAIMQAEETRRVRTESRPLRLAVAGVAGICVLAAAAYAATSREVEAPGAVACASTFSQTADMTIVERVERQPATATCVSEMRGGAWNPPPTNPVECVTNYPGGDGGALLVVPAPEGMSQEEACSAIGAAVPEE